MSVKHRVNLNIFFSSFVYSMSDDTVYYIDCEMVLSAEKQSSFVLLSAKVKKVAIKFHKNLNLRNQFHKDAIKVAYQIDETLEELKMKYPKIVEALERIL